VVPGKYTDKAVQSNRSIVANIQPFLKDKITTEEFRKFLLDVQLEHEENAIYDLSEKDYEAIQKLVKEKFSTWAWNFGYSPKYTFQNQSNWGERTLSVGLTVEKGWIADASISGDFFSEQKADLLKQKLPGKRHYFDDIKELLEEIHPDIPEELVFAFF
jgi:lipoate-protein ligase A